LAETGFKEAQYREHAENNWEPISALWLSNHLLPQHSIKK